MRVLYNFDIGLVGNADRGRITFCWTEVDERADVIGGEGAAAAASVMGA